MWGEGNNDHQGLVFPEGEPHTRRRFPGPLLGIQRWTGVRYPNPLSTTSETPDSEPVPLPGLRWYVYALS